MEYCFSCLCAPGFTGVRCESNIDDCLSHKCENNATCTDLVSAYECKCLPGYMGKYLIEGIIVELFRLHCIPIVFVLREEELAVYALRISNI